MINHYYYDFEFLEGKQKEKFPISLFRKYTKPTIDVISVGIVSGEDNREYYAISKDFNLKEAWNRYDLKSYSGKGGIGENTHEKVYWLRDNVLKSIYDDLFKRIVSDDNMLTGDEYVYFTYSNLKKLINRYGKSNKQIAEEIKEFVPTGARLNNYLEE